MVRIGAGGGDVYMVTGGGRSGQVHSADSYVLYSEGRAGVCMYGIGWDGMCCMCGRWISLSA